MAERFHSVSTGLRPEVFDAVMDAARARNLTVSELMREALRALNIPIPKTAREQSRPATKPTRPTVPTPPSRRAAFTGLTPHARLTRRSPRRT
ncbi:hypothetical protein [Roseococcus pinisoli]|uniref:Ribbon-helix-helix protein CopG domain-containing protein n=1 Tax=Roseococcus pinisoli TaxID=2835040 RepID=A0ABS5QGQ5_9PROT|nr:hypothetical protein [Roseococcus pinisoli]MBS7812860.1 hypothetical protein [Roseococcus pinisoli]